MCNKQIVVMKKFFRMVMALSLVGGAFAFTGCTDYEDDINALDDRVSALESTVADLQSKIDAGAVITDVTETADGVTVTLSDGSTFTISNGKAGAPGSVVTIGANGNWFIDGVDTGKPSQGAAGADGKPGADGDDADIVFYRPNMETGNWDKVTISAETGEETVEPTQDSWRAEGVTAVWDPKSGTLTFANVEGSEDPIVITFGDFLKAVEFVPEYSDGKMNATAYYLGDPNENPSTWLYLGDIENPTYSLTGTFKVTPASYAAKLVESPELVSMAVLPVKTRAAQSEILRVPVNVSYGLGEGQIVVDAVIPQAAFAVAPSQGYNDAMVALYVADENIKEGSVAEDEDSTEVSYVSSSYVGVVRYLANIAESFAFYNPTTNQVLYSGDDQEFNEAWSEAPAEVKYYDGYVFGLTLNGAFYTIDGAAEILGVDASLITPVFKGEVNKAESKSVYPADLKDPVTDVTKLLTYTEDDFASSIKMAKDKETMQSYVGSYLTVDNTFTLVFDEGYGVPDTEFEVFSNKVRYNVVNTSYTLKLAAKAQPWSYRFAKEHSTTATAADLYDKDIDFREVEIEEFPTAIDADDIRTIIGSADAPVAPAKENVTVSVGGTVIPDAYLSYYGLKKAELTLNNIATEVAQIASVTINGGTYSFSQLGEVVYTFKYVYPIDELGEEAVDADFTVEFQLTMGALPEDPVIALDPVQVPYSENWDKVTVPVDDAHAKAYAAMSDYFDSEDAFRVAFDEDNLPQLNEQTWKAERNGDAIDVSQTRLRVNIMQPNAQNNKIYDEKSVIEFFDGAMAEVGDEFTYRTTVETWYGVTFTFATEAEVVAPGYALEYAANNVTDGKVVVKGKLINDKFTLDQADLADYFTVKNYDGKANLDVKFEVLTKAGQGDTWVPATLSSTAPVDVEANASVKNVGYLKSGVATITWPNPNAKRAVEIKASLVMGETVLDTKTITVEAEDPITYTETVEMTKTRTPGEESGMTANLWEAIKIYGATRVYAVSGYDETNNIEVKAGDLVNLVNPEATDVNSMFNCDEIKVRTGYDKDGKPIYADKATAALNAQQAYNINYALANKLGFAAEIVKTEVNGAETPVTTFDYNPAAGTLTYTGNNASLQGKTVTFYVKFSFKHYLSENAAKSVTVKVNFKEE